MNKLIFLGLLVLIPYTSLFAEEYISTEYFEQVTSDINESIITFDELNTSTEIIDTKLVEDNNFTMIEEEIIKEVTEELSPYLKALKQAKSEGKIIMIAIRATTCHYCDRMDAETLNDSSIKGELEANFITLYYNQDLEPLPLGLQEGMTPKFVFVNTHEDILNMYPGMRNPDEFKEVLDQILAM